MKELSPQPSGSEARTCQELSRQRCDRASRRSDQPDTWGVDGLMVDMGSSWIRPQMQLQSQTRQLSSLSKLQTARSTQAVMLVTAGPFMRLTMPAITLPGPTS